MDFIEKYCHVFVFINIFGEGKIFGKLQRLHSLDSRTVKEIEANFHFWGGENFWKIAKIAFLRYPVGRKFAGRFCRNRLFSYGYFGLQFC